jgi:hypothetical protein
MFLIRCASSIKMVLYEPIIWRNFFSPAFSSIALISGSSPFKKRNSPFDLHQLVSKVDLPDWRGPRTMIILPESHSLLIVLYSIRSIILLKYIDCNHLI